MDYNNIVKYFRGESTEKEIQQIFKWIEENPENKKEFAELKRIWSLTAKEAENENVGWKNVQSIFAKKKRNKKLYRFARQAAVFILLFGLGGMSHYFLTFKEKEEPVYAENYSVTAPLGQMTNLELPDGTIVLLNSGSTITYNSDFSFGKRQVSLEGEAFFDVRKDSEYPFIVKSQLLDIKVYGTSFNIEAYPEAENFKATLVEGSISVLDKTGSEITLLKPGENASYSINQKQLIVNNVNTEIYTSWKEGLITFRNEKLEDIAKRIERWYNVEIVIRNDKLGNERYFGTILKNKPIDQILEVFKLTTSLQYKIVQRANEPTLIYWD